MKMSRLRFYLFLLFLALAFMPVFLIGIFNVHEDFKGQIENSANVLASVDAVQVFRSKRQGTTIHVTYSFPVGSELYDGIETVADNDEWNARSDKSKVSIYYLKSNPRINGFAEKWDNKADVRPIEWELMFAFILALTAAALVSGLAVFVSGFFPDEKNPFMVKI